MLRLLSKKNFKQKNIAVKTNDVVVTVRDPLSKYFSDIQNASQNMNYLVILKKNITYSFDFLNAYLTNYSLQRIIVIYYENSLTPYHTKIDDVDLYNININNIDEIKSLMEFYLLNNNIIIIDSDEEHILKQIDIINVNFINNFKINWESLNKVDFMVLNNERQIFNPKDYTYDELKNMFPIMISKQIELTKNRISNDFKNIKLLFIVYNLLENDKVVHDSILKQIDHLINLSEMTTSQKINTLHNSLIKMLINILKLIVVDTIDKNVNDLFYLLINNIQLINNKYQTSLN